MTTEQTIEMNYYPISLDLPTEGLQTNTPPTAVESTNVATAPSGTILNGGTLTSPNFHAGASGWRLDTNGNIEANDGNFRGDITGATGTFTGAVAASQLDIGGDDATSAHIDSGGGMWLGASVANKATAPARISSGGAAIFTNISATGTINADAGYLGNGTYIGAVDALLVEATGLNVGTTGHIRGNSSDYLTDTGFFLGYSGGQYKFSVGNPATSYISWDGATMTVAGVSQITKAFTAGENLLAGDAVSIAPGTTTTAALGSFVSSTIFQDADRWYAQRWTSPSVNHNKLTSADFRFSSGFTESYTCIFELRADTAGNPGAVITSKSRSCSLTASDPPLELAFTLDTPYELTPSTNYWITIRQTGGTYARLYVSRDATASNSKKTTDGGANWVAGDGVLHADVNYTLGTASRVYKSDSTAAADWLNNSFIGFALNNITAAASGQIIISGIATGLSSLTIGGFYYLTDTEGTISTTHGTQTRKVGFATSATELNITNIW